MIVYMDDILILGASSEETTRLTVEVVLFLTRLGWTLNLDKCRLVPTQTVQFVGWEFNFSTMSLKTTPARRRELLHQLRDWLQWSRQRQRVRARDLAGFLGTLNFLRTQWEGASLYMARMNNTLNKMVKRWGWNSNVTLSPLLAEEIKCWLKPVTHNDAVALRVAQPSVTLTTDASPWGWGASLETADNETVRLWDTWADEQQGLTSNHKEFLAILLALTQLQEHHSETRVIRVLTDNTAAAFNIQRWKGVRRRIPVLRRLWNLCSRRQWSLTVHHLPGTANDEADALSRMGAA
jgi:ribonuclease HI